MDVGETMNVVASLLPVLKSDGGRVVAVVPCAFRSGAAAQEKAAWEYHEEKRQVQEDDRLEFDVTRRALLEMWSILQQRLARQGIQVSQVHMSAPAKARSSLPSLGKAGQQRPTKLQLALRHILGKTHYTLYPVPQTARALPPYADSHRSFIAPRLLQDDDGTEACPSLLLDAVRNILVRSWPRRHYCVGLGPRLEIAWEYVPGHDRLRGWINDALLA
jgi:NAD(P)-dependent dehydrogenase (short-subunit alcohol dehydrogenase family)